MTKLLRPLLFTFAFFAATAAASATTLDFKAMGNGGTYNGVTYGESAWSPLVLAGSGFNLTISAIKSGNPAFAYLDAGNAGLGVCGALLAGTTTGAKGTSTINLCNPGSDDNITTGETLKLRFDQNVTISTIWFNNNHDGDHSLLNNTIMIGGSAFMFTNGGSYVDSFTTSSYNVLANTDFLISYGGTAPDEFYLSKMNVSTTPVQNPPTAPEPASIALLGLGIAGLGLVHKRRNKA